MFEKRFSSKGLDIRKEQNFRAGEEPKRSEWTAHPQ